MAINHSALGMNARNYLYIRPYNKKGAKKRADDKLATKKRFIKEGIKCPRLLVSFEKNSEIRSFDWTSLPKKFVVKPARGYAGEGIYLVRKWDGEQGELPDGTIIVRSDLERIFFDILTGGYSLQGGSDSVIVEEMIIPKQFYKQMPKNGVPDIRLIVFSSVPIMAELRFPTEKSNGKANLSQGAIGIGIDITSGVTTEGYLNKKRITHFPNTQIKIAGLKIPYWDEILHEAVNASKVIRLGFAGVDIVIDENKGPMIIEMNARPGLEIQQVNGASLRERFERVSHIKPEPTVERGVRISKTLFATQLSEKVKSKEKQKIVIGIIEDIILYDVVSKTQLAVKAKIDTGADSTSLDKKLAESIAAQRAKGTKTIRSASGRSKRKVVSIDFSIRGKRIKTKASVTDRDHLNYQMIIGKNDLKNFLIDPAVNTIE